ncbi:hypothetical protein [Bosea sp. (in: a-proteobacteria)]|uniref:hypothetical protein n=1 Tax=Bosea sp. (in: a-proteobacteria) TaxID=1871050 RepID=UPI00122A2E00|nr:hypothetical protein [Bosea sp. (in: a-proteobacteria)]TAJ31040.1 MAG: hypothetical protein EPO59_09420 [Bosea sp. (in: a-proteobacteria)]
MIIGDLRRLIRGDAMTSRLQIVGLLFATLTLSTVAAAQQGGGGRGGDGGSGGDSGSRDDSIIAIRLQDHERLRVPRPVTMKAAQANCRTHACNEPPQRAEPIVLMGDGCSEQVVARDRQGRTIRRICRMN